MLKEFKRSNDGLSKEERKAAVKSLRKALAARQSKLRDAKIPVIVLVEGWDSAGKGGLINDLISELDPRFISVFSLDEALEGSEDYPFLYPYFNAIPENGKLLFMDSGYMEESVHGLMSGELDEDAYALYVQSSQRFERTLRDNGYLLIKFFMNITRKEQSKRFSGLLQDENTAWRVTEDDLWQNSEYKGFRKCYENFMAQTSEVAPWHILDGESSSKSLYDALKIICDTVDAAIEAGKYNAPAHDAEFPMTETVRLADADLSLTVEESVYKEELKKLQNRLYELHNEVHRLGIPVVVCYEGWDAAGKGGNIKRLTYPLDPRGFEVFPIASPEPHELARHYLWRFWKRMPKIGNVAIFDRTWYGRCMVERIEGFCTENDWQRSYNEINEFEEELYNWGAVILKFWIHIDQDTQLQRFNDRQNTPEKQWKITEEDWRNREKWPQYEAAVSEMLEKTSTEYAPWHIIESNDKHYARLKVLRLTVAALEEAVAEYGENDG